MIDLRALNDFVISEQEHLKANEIACKDDESQKLAVLKERLRLNLFGPSELNFKHISSAEELIAIRLVGDNQRNQSTSGIHPLFAI